LLATWIPTSKQVLDDLDGLMTFMQSTLPYYINLCEELHGLIPRSTPFNKAFLLATGATKLDAIGAIESAV
jgi:hypothetical protein